MSNVGMSVKMKPRHLRQHKVWRGRIPGLGRFAFTRDPGEGSFLDRYNITTHLGAIVRYPDGKIIEEYDLGSGKITDLGTLAMSYDAQWGKTAKEVALTTLGACKWHAWGTGSGSEEVKQFQLKAYAKPTEEKAVEAKNEAKFTEAIEGAKIVSTAKITAESTVAVTEWGLFSAQEKLNFAAKAATAVTATSLEDTVGKPFTKTEAKVRGNLLYTLWAEKTEEALALITETNSTEKAEVLAWIKASENKVTKATTPEATSKYKLLPLMFDRRLFSVINVESGNVIEFPWELEIRAGG